jgi:energy-coupling factor transporter ATP-binding protein EcfA2
MARVELSGTTFCYAGSKERALDGVTLAFEPGELVALAGPAGAGTSTLLLVTGGYAPRVVGGTIEGRRTIDARQPAIVFATPWTQLTGLCHTVFAEVAFGPASHGRPREAIRETVGRELERMRIAHLATRDPATLSGGELQRTIVAAALALEPDLLLLDDPGAELDPEAADHLYEELKTIAASGVTVVVATPDVERASVVATRGVMLEAGRVTHDGDPSVLRA